MDVLSRVSAIEGKRDYLHKMVGDRREKAQSLSREVEVLQKVAEGYVGMADNHVTSFCEALCQVVNHVLEGSFGDYRVHVEPVGETGYRICVKDGDLVDSVADSQGEGLVNVVSIASLLATMAVSPRVEGDFLLLDEPFGGALHDDRLGRLYQWLSDASKELGIQVIATTHHQSAVDAADNSILTQEPVVSYRI
jgi:hypothetical protein